MCRMNHQKKRKKKLLLNHHVKFKRRILIKLTISSKSNIIVRINRTTRWRAERIIEKERKKKHSLLLNLHVKFRILIKLTIPSKSNIIVRINRTWWCAEWIIEKERIFIKPTRKIQRKNLNKISSKSNIRINRTIRWCAEWNWYPRSCWGELELEEKKAWDRGVTRR